jgi:DNA modification methylase
MPVDVMRRVVGIINPEYVIVDPFMGSGTTAIACIKEKRHFIGFELSKDYFKLAKRNIELEQRQPTLF